LSIASRSLLPKRPSRPSRGNRAIITASTTLSGTLCSKSVDCSTIETEFDPQSMVPAVGVTTPAMALSSVDLPEPLGPITATVAPAGMSRLTPSSATVPP